MSDEREIESMTERTSKRHVERAHELAESSEQPVVVDISDVEPTAQRIVASELRVGDVVFDIWGGKHRVEYVRKLKHSIVFRRDDQRHSESFHRDRELTIIRESEG